MERLSRAKRVVVKIGSSLLVDGERGEVKRAWLAALAEDVAAAKGRGSDLVLVSSGAIALGRRRLGLAAGDLRLEEAQAAASVGQIRLAQAYQEVLGKHDISAAQILLTSEDTEERRRYLNARTTLTALLAHGAVPVINENDTVATAEIRFGDNDRLAARVAAMLGADCLVLLSDIDGLYTADPRKDGAARLLREVRAITPEIEAMGGESISGFGKGGMTTKLQAARIALDAGCHMVIADGRKLHPLANVVEEAPCTWFVAGASPATARKRWIAGSLKPAGSIRIDAGAAAALRRGKSLLPAGVAAVEGQFQRGDAVVVRGPDGEELGRGLIAYAREDAERIIGHNSRDIERLLGHRGRDEMIHRDDLVISGKAGEPADLC
jgi:glutamate 5-kinase